MVLSDFLQRIILSAIILIGVIIVFAIYIFWKEDLEKRKKILKDYEDELEEEVINGIK